MENAHHNTVIECLEGKRILFCYLDEAGDFNFSRTGTEYYIYTALVTNEPLGLNDDMLKAKYRLALSNLPFSKSHEKNDFFHAAEDAPLTRKLAFETIERHLGEFRIYSLVVQKNRVAPEFREQRTFFFLIMSRLIEEIVNGEEVSDKYDHLCIFTDTIPVQRKNSAIISAIKKNLKALLGVQVGYSLRPMESKTDFGLQAADYCSWAIYRSRTTGDTIHRSGIAAAIALETVFLGESESAYY